MLSLDERRELIAKHQMKDCPFCGHAVSSNDDDTLYPVTRDANVWGMHCPEPAGGCGCQVLGFTPEEAIAKWNTRKSKFSEKFDKGPWMAYSVDEYSVGLQSDDFTYDVNLKISGDFGSQETRLAYATALANKLNN